MPMVSCYEFFRKRYEDGCKDQLVAAALEISRELFVTLNPTDDTAEVPDPNGNECMIRREGLHLEP